MPSEGNSNARDLFSVRQDYQDEGIEPTVTVN